MRSRCVTMFAVAVVAVLLAWAPPASADRITALTTAPPRLLEFASETPGTIDSDTAISGLDDGEEVLALDRRPTTGELFLLTTTAGVERLRSVDPATGAVGSAVTLQADPADLTAPFTTVDTSGGVGIDFNTAVDRLRVVTASDENLRVDPSTGMVTTDAPLAYSGGGSAAVTSVAYQELTPTTSLLYGLDAASNSLVTHNPPNAGVLNLVGSTGLTPFSTINVGFDISPWSGTAYLSASACSYRLYTIDLSSGAASGPLTISSSFEQIRDITVSADDEPPATPDPSSPNPDTSAPAVADTLAPVTDIGRPIYSEGVYRVTLTCPDGELRCDWTYALKSTARIGVPGKKHRVKLGSGTASAAGGATSSVAITFSKPRLRLLRRRGPLPVTLSVATLDAAGNGSGGTRRSVLRPHTVVRSGC